MATLRSLQTRWSRARFNVQAPTPTRIQKLVAVPDGWVGLVGSSTHQLVLQSLVRNHPELLDFSSRVNIFESLLSLQPLLLERYLIRTDEGDTGQPYDSNQLDGLICNRHGIFGFLSYREVTEYTRFWAVGSGRRLAMGAMHALYDRLASIEEIARAGVSAACVFEEDCAEPIHLHTVKLDG